MRSKKIAFSFSFKTLYESYYDRIGGEERSDEERSEGDWKVKGATGTSDRREEHLRDLCVCVWIKHGRRLSM